MDIISNIKQFFDRKTISNAEIDRFARFAKSRRGIKLTAQLMQQTDSLTKKDIATWRQAWQMAIGVDNPNRSMLYDIYTDCIIDLHLTGCIGQRKGKTLQKEFRLVGKDGKENEQATALLKKEWFFDFMDLALDSRFWGHSLIQLGDVINDAEGIHFNGVELVPRKHVCPEFGVILREVSDDPRNGISYRDGDFANWCVEVGKPKDLGLLLKCAPACISKKNMLAFWDMFGEIFGAPMRVARTNTQDAKERSKIEQALDKMGAAFWALFPEGTDIEIKESSRGDAYNVYDKRVDRCNSELSKGTLMQTMTIDSGSSLSQSETHLEIFEDVIAADARFVACIVNDKLLPLMLKHGFPVKGCTFLWNDTLEYTPQEQINVEQMIINGGYDIDPQYFVDKYGIPIIGKRQANLPTNNLVKQLAAGDSDFFI